MLFYFRKLEAALIKLASAEQRILFKDGNVSYCFAKTLKRQNGVIGQLTLLFLDGSSKSAIFNPQH